MNYLVAYPNRLNFGLWGPIEHIYQDAWGAYLLHIRVAPVFLTADWFDRMKLRLISKKTQSIFSFLFLDSGEDTGLCYMAIYNDKSKQGAAFNSPAVEAECSPGEKQLVSKLTLNELDKLGEHVFSYAELFLEDPRRYIVDVLFQASSPCKETVCHHARHPYGRMTPKNWKTTAANLTEKLRWNISLSEEKLRVPCTLGSKPPSVPEGLS